MSRYALRSALVIPAFALAAVVFVTAGDPSPSLTPKEAFFKEEADWRAQREARLKQPDGWLAVAGLFWLHEGNMAAGSDPRSDIVLPSGAPKRAGVFQTHAGVVKFLAAAGAAATISGKPAPNTAMPLKPDTDDHPDVVRAGSITLTIIKRGDKVGVRMRDPNAVTRSEFTGCNWFPTSQMWKVRAKWVAYPEPKKIKITNILGMTDDEPSPGYAEFSIGGKTVRLEPVGDNTGLSFMFKDATSGNASYAPGRFLDTDFPRNGVVILDFNQAYNPPCAFTAFATCPLPPKQNVLAIAVEAGEKKYNHHPVGGSH